MATQESFLHAVLVRFASIYYALFIAAYLAWCFKMSSTNDWHWIAFGVVSALLGAGLLSVLIYHTCRKCGCPCCFGRAVPKAVDVCSQPQVDV